MRVCLQRLGRGRLAVGYTLPRHLLALHAHLPSRAAACLWLRFRLGALNMGVQTHPKGQPRPHARHGWRETEGSMQGLSWGRGLFPTAASAAPLLR